MTQTDRLQMQTCEQKLEWLNKHLGTKISFRDWERMGILYLWDGEFAVKKQEIRKEL